MMLVVGLGNPGGKYAGNRHNIGFMAVEALARRHGLGPFRRKFQAQVADGQIGPWKVLLLMPETFMNLSGQAVGEAARFHKIPPEHVIVMHDELDLPPGKVRVKRGGGAGGHNGLRSIDQHLGNDYWRVRLGIGHPGHKDRVTSHVLGDFAKADQTWLDPLLNAVAGEAPLMLQGIDAGEPGAFMSKVAAATRPPKPERPARKPKTAKEGGDESAAGEGSAEADPAAKAKPALAPLAAPPSQVPAPGASSTPQTGLAQALLDAFKRKDR